MFSDGTDVRSHRSSKEALYARRPCIVETRIARNSGKHLFARASAPCYPSCLCEENENMTRQRSLPV